MAILEILQFPDPRLRIKAKPVTKVDAEILRLVDDMYETMYHAQGVGLAATQVGVNLQIFTMDVSSTQDQRACILNPEIISKEGVVYEGEGCLSVVGAYDKVERAAKVRLRGMHLDGTTFEVDAEGLMAVCFQHEVDHLNGVLFVDHLSKLKRDRIRAKIAKFKNRE